MLTIKLARVGKTKEPSFRLILVEKTKDPLGSYLENLGVYNARQKLVEIKKDRVLYWLSKGAQPTATVNNLLVDQKIISSAKVKKVKITGRRKAKIAEKKKTAEVPQA